MAFGDESSSQVLTPSGKPADPIDVAVGARIRVRRRQVGVSQEVLGTHLGLTFQQVQKYERGANRVSTSMLVKTAEKLQTSVAYLVGETLDPELPGARDSATMPSELTTFLMHPNALVLLTALNRLSRNKCNRLIDVAVAMAEEGDD